MYYYDLMFVLVELDEEMILLVHIVLLKVNPELRLKLLLHVFVLYDVHQLNVNEYHQLYEIDQDYLLLDQRWD